MRKSLLVLVCSFVASVAMAETLPVFSEFEAGHVCNQMQLPGLDFETAGHWNQFDGKPVCIVEKPHFTPKAVSLSSKGLKYSRLIDLPKHGELKYEFWTIANTMKTVNFQVSYFDAKGQWLRRTSPVLAIGNQYSWQQHEGTIPAVGGAAKVSLEFYGSGYINDIKIFQTEYTPEVLKDQKLAGNDITLDPADHEILANDGYEIYISRQTGLVTRIVSLIPSRKIIQPAGKNSMQVYMESRAKGADAPKAMFNKLLDMKKIEKNKIQCRMGTSNADVAKIAEVTLTYTLMPDRFDVAVDYRILKDDNNPWTLGMHNVADIKQWQKQIAPTFPIGRHDAVSRSKYSFGFDILDQVEKPVGISYPCMVMESDDRYWLWGSLDLGKYLVLTPNDRLGRLPAVQLNPKALKKEESPSFTMTYCVFPRETNDFTQVMGWYVRNYYSTDPLTKDYIKWQPKPFGRRFTPGCMAWYHPGAVGIEYNGWRSFIKKTHATNVWYSWWSNWQEIPLSEGDWWTYDSRHLSAAGLRAEIQHMKKMGLHVYLYFRQFLVEDGTYDDKVPYKKWLCRDKDGKRVAFIDFKVPQPETIGGIKTIKWTMADFGNAEYRKWYLGHLKKAVDYYQPSGIAWDMGWGAIGVPSRANRRSNVGHGTVLVQAKVYEWLKQKYPEMRVVVNEAIASPSNLFADATMIEGAWDICHKSSLDYQTAAAYGNTMFSLQLVDDYGIQLYSEKRVKKGSYLVVKARGENLLSGGFGGDVFDLVKSGLKLDGQWQTLFIPIKKDMKFRVPGITIKANDKGNAYLEIQRAVITSNRPDSKKDIKDIAAYIELLGSKSRIEDYPIVGKWNHDNPAVAGIERKGDVVRVSIDQPAGTAHWMMTDEVIGRWRQNTLRTLGLGAICSDSQVVSADSLNALLAKLAAMKLVVKYKAIYGLPEKVYGSVWMNSSKELVVAVYNDTQAGIKLKAYVDKKALPVEFDNVKALRSFIVKPDCKTGYESGEIKESAERIGFSADLPAGHLLLLVPEKVAASFK